MKFPWLQGLGLCACLAFTFSEASGQPVRAATDPQKPAAFDLVETAVTRQGDHLVFRSRVRGGAGRDKPAATGKFEGSDVYAYVWPTTLNSGDIGFDPDQGIVALAATFHPDFDDGAKGARNRDRWHSHWVVLSKDDACGAGLKVRDIPAGTKPKLPATWPGAPILIDSPDFPPSFAGDAVEVRVPLAAVARTEAALSFDGVTAGLKVNANLHAPLLCVANVFKIASGDLSLPGRVAGRE